MVECCCYRDDRSQKEDGSCSFKSMLPYLVFTEHGEDYKIKVNTELSPKYFFLTLLGRSLVELKVKGPVHLIVHFTHCPVLRSELPVNRGLH